MQHDPRTTPGAGTSANAAADDNLLEVRNLRTYYPVLGGVLRRPCRLGQGCRRRVVRHQQGETLGLVGESGCGKTTLGRSIVRLHEPQSGAGAVRGQGRPRPRGATAEDGAARTCRSSSRTRTARLNPRMPVGDIIGEGLHGPRHDEPRRARAQVAQTCCRVVGLRKEHARRYPHEFSRRPAPAHRHRAGAGAASEVCGRATSRSRRSTCRSSRRC